MSSKSAGANTLSRLVIALGFGACASGLGSVQAAESAHPVVAKSAPCLSCFRAEIRTVAEGTLKDDTLDATLCRSAMSSSPPLTPVCGGAIGSR